MASAAVLSRVVVLLLRFIVYFCFLLDVPVCDCVWCLFCCAALISFLVLQSSRWERESGLLCFNCLLDSIRFLFFTVSWVGLQCHVDWGIFKSYLLLWSCYPPTKSKGYSFGVVRACVRSSVLPSVRPSTLFVCPEPYLSTYWSDLIHSWYE